jgi:hypothetical protein
MLPEIATDTGILPTNCSSGLSLLRYFVLENGKTHAPEAPARSEVSVPILYANYLTARHAPPPLRLGN